MPKIPGRREESKIFSRVPEGRLPRANTQTHQVLESIGGSAVQLGVELLAQQKKIQDTTYAFQSASDNAVEASKIIEEEFRSFAGTEENIDEFVSGKRSDFPSGNIKARLGSLFDRTQKQAPSETAKRLYVSQQMNQFRTLIAKAENNEKAVLAKGAARSIDTNVNKMTLSLQDTESTTSALSFAAFESQRMESRIDLLTGTLWNADQAATMKAGLKNKMAFGLLASIETKAILNHKFAADGLAMLDFDQSIGSSVPPQEAFENGFIVAAERDALVKAEKNFQLTGPAPDFPPLRATENDLMDSISPKQKQQWTRKFLALATSGRGGDMSIINQRMRELKESAKDGEFDKEAWNTETKPLIENHPMQQIAKSQLKGNALIFRTQSDIVADMSKNHPDMWDKQIAEAEALMDETFKEAAAADPSLSAMKNKSFLLPQKKDAIRFLESKKALIIKERKADFATSVLKAHPGMLPLAEKAFASPSDYTAYANKMESVQKGLRSPGVGINILTSGMARNLGSQLSAKNNARDVQASLGLMRAITGGKRRFRMALTSLQKFKQIDGTFRRTLQFGADNQDFETVLSALRNAPEINDNFQKTFGDEAGKKAKEITKENLSQNGKLYDAMMLSREAFESFGAVQKTRSVIELTAKGLMGDPKQSGLSASEAIEKATFMTFKANVATGGSSSILVNKDFGSESEQKLIQSWLKFHSSRDGFKVMMNSHGLTWKGIQSFEAQRKRGVSKGQVDSNFLNFLEREAVWVNGSSDWMDATLVWRQTRVEFKNSPVISIGDMITDPNSLKQREKDRSFFGGVQDFFLDLLPDIGEGGTSIDFDLDRSPK